ncbi:hypothetical protein RHSIM_RhsimUnG0246700 [Rhododendron simsii]|uniref:Pre-mRNA-splicing factor Syf1-like N-terminal HAT-repeats domain-containing protein n=1 Tax=Rhododendron simsii TaxID=118357 RepID=A0A834FV38_RHOSS|nr:hypothetical protein RHSIM_RhsimUnG0246700 [Rhododendron simsii]
MAKAELRARPVRVKNKTPAPIQITAEQILREGLQEQAAADSLVRAPACQITDEIELDRYLDKKRKSFENLIRRAGPTNPAKWISYARWEESRPDFARARSVFERALSAHRSDHTLFLSYAAFEMRNEFLSHARNVWDRAVSVFPRIDQLWYKYAHMEEMIGNFPGARRVFDRWMRWEPDQEAWLSYVRFELRYKEIERARSIFEGLVRCRNRACAWIAYAKFEIRNGEILKARECYERAVEKLVGQEEEAVELLVAFAGFEEICKETERARGIYKFVLDRIPRDRTEYLYGKFLAFERLYGCQESIEDVIMAKRKFEYEDEVRKNPFNYDVWFDYIWLEESLGRKEKVREVYERAIANVPPAAEKRFWERYIYLWIWYALYEEVDVNDVDRARAVYKECLALIPHDKFSFSKIWLMAADFEIRRLNLKGARVILGNAIGRAPKGTIFEKYIELEWQLGNIDRVRRIYEKYLEWSPENASAWMKYAGMEIDLEETDSARAIFEVALSQPALDKPEDLWKASIDFESVTDRERARELFERLLELTKNVKVWISYGEFEACADEGDNVHERIDRARKVYQRGIDYFKIHAPKLKEERVMLLEHWLTTEASFGELGDTDSVHAMKPKKIKRRRHGEVEKGVAVYEEYIDYLFPEELEASNIKLFQAAYRWKKQKIAS